ncbi:hypothetical protein BGW39_008979 [Mortierella sp. 14UC]|nr:hypothetical protein BGW39_008979 [Mortierella sp. 14UC]
MSNSPEPNLDNRVNHTAGPFKAHPALQQALDTPGPLSLEDDLADRFNKIAITQSENGTFDLASTRTFRQAMFAKVHSPPTPPPHPPPMVAPSPPLTPAFWNAFWKNAIPHNARNAWWHLLIKKLPSGSVLHSLFPKTRPLVCRICQVHVETDVHLLFSCPKKLQVWQDALSRYVEDRTWSADYICSLFFPDPDPVQPRDDVPIFLLIGAILATIWRYHFAFVI